MGGLFSAPKTTPVTQPTMEEVDHDAEEARRRELQKEKARRGRSSTILTGSTGDSSEAKTTATLLGG